jgi:hypothetical protein
MTNKYIQEVATFVTFESIIMENYNHKDDWFFEGQISSRLITYLRKHDYKIIKDNSHNISEHGADIIAKSPTGVTEVIEVKGYPTAFYTNGNKKGEPKRTNPKLQAKHWFSEAILSCMFNYSKHTDKGKFRLGLAFPLHERYKELISKVENYYTVHQIDFMVYFIDEIGNVTIDNLCKHKR